MSRSSDWLLGLFLLVIALPVQAAQREAASATGLLAGKVTRVIDGDTIDVLLTSGPIRVRLHGIDAPERDQAGGAAAGSWLDSRLKDREVLLEPVAQDQYDRMVAVVHLADSNINRELVAQGHAWAYRRYLRREDLGLCAVELRARRSRSGVWAIAEARAPWEHRATDGKGPWTDYARETGRSCRQVATSFLSGGR